MARNQRKYDHEYKVQAVKLAREIGGTKAAKELGRQYASSSSPLYPCVSYFHLRSVAEMLTVTPSAGTKPYVPSQSVFHVNSPCGITT